jgi:hypothetical protein
MLSANEFSVGYLANAVGLTLVLAQETGGTSFIVAPTGQSMIAIALEGSHRFSSFDCRGNTHWQGLLIPNIMVEVDETSISQSMPLGVLVRTGTTLAIKTKLDRLGTQSVPLIENLTACGEGLSAVFSHWSVVLGEGRSKRTLKSIEVT